MALPRDVKRLLVATQNMTSCVEWARNFLRKLGVTKKPMITERLVTAEMEDKTIIRYEETVAAGRKSVIVCSSVLLML